MSAARTRRVGPAVLALLAAAFFFSGQTARPDDQSPGNAAQVPLLRKIFVPASRPEVWPPGDWQPIPLSELEQKLRLAETASHPRPRAFLERADYSATLTGAELTSARLEWIVRRTDTGPCLLMLDRLNLNVANLVWSDSDSTRAPQPAVWGADPAGRTAIVIERSRGTLAGDWQLEGRSLAASTEFDVELCPAESSRLALTIPAGLVLSASTGELSPPSPASQPGWNVWRLNLGSRTACRLRVAAPPQAGAERPLVLVRSNLNYFVKSEAVRLLADFEIDVLESTCRELRLMADPDVQVTAVEIGNDSATLWRTTATSAGQEIVVPLTDAISGAGHTLQVQGIAQVKQFAAWTLPHIRVQNAVEVSGRVTLGMQTPNQAADIRTEGYRQIELSPGADEGEVLVFRQLRSDGSITIVPTDMKAELTCRATTHIQADSQQWFMESEWEWKAASGSSYSANWLLPEKWEVVDVRPTGREPPRELSGWEVQTAEPGRQILHVYFLNALKPGRAHSVHISARRLPPAASEPATLPPLVPAENCETEQIVAVTTGSDWRAVVDDLQGIERLSVRDLQGDAPSINFLRSRLNQRGAGSVILKADGTSARGILRIEPASPAHEFNQPMTHNQNVEDERGTSALPEAHDIRPPRQAESREAPVTQNVRVEVCGLETGFDHYEAEFQFSAAAGDSFFSWRLRESAELLGVFRSGRRVAPEKDQNAWRIEVPKAAGGVDAGNEPVTVQIEYRVRAATHRGPNTRPLILPQTDQPVLKFNLSLILPEDCRLGGTSFDDDLRRMPWHRALWGVLSSLDAPLFNPLSGRDWLSLLYPRSEMAAQSPPQAVWRTSAVAPPSAGASFVVWKAHEVWWLSWAALLASLLGGLFARLRALTIRPMAIAGMLAALSLAALTLSPIYAQFAGSALAGLVLVLLLPQRFLIFPRRPVREEITEIPVGSTQSFVTMTGMLVGGAALALCVSMHAQEAFVRPTEGKPARPVADVLVPTGEDGLPAGKEPLAYAPADLLTSLKAYDPSKTMPDYLIGASSFEGTVDDANRLLVVARFDVHVFSTSPVVPLHLALGRANLGGDNACLVNGLTHAVRADAGGQVLIVELAGLEEAPEPPELPEPQRVEVGRPDEPDASNTTSTMVLRMRTFQVVLRLHPSVDAAQGDLFTAAISVPRGCRTEAAISSPTALPVLGVAPIDAVEPRSQMVLPAAPRASIRPGPGTKLLFFWSRAASQPGGLTGTMKARGQAQRQVAVSCLADVSPSLIEMHYHLAYRVAAGSLGSLVWRVPAGLVLESLQAPQLAGYRFVPGVDGARHLEIEFSKPQRGDFSLAAKFDYAVDQNQKQIFLPLVDPLSDDGGARGDAGLQFHQIAVRQPSESRVTVTAAHPGQSLKSRPVDEFLKEWNAGGARPQQAFELDRLFEVNLAIESLASVPAVHGSSIARFHPHRLDWTYTADVAPNSVPQFVYRLAVDPRARIKSISVLEDGAERLLRWSQVRDAVVLFLSDRATRAQTIRIDASLPLTGSPVIELPRARFPGAPPDRERVTIYRDDAVAVRFDNPDEAPPALPEDSAIGASREILVARVDLAPEQNPPRLVVEPVLPRISAETATIIEESGDAWRTTMCVAFHVAAGRATEFTLELPESSASRLAIRSVPESRVVSRPGPDGRVVLTFYPDEPVLDRFVAVLSGSIDRPRTPRQPPSIALPGVEQTATLLVAPTGILAPLPAGARSAAPIENWITQVVPEAAHAGFESYRLPAGGPLPELHPIGRQSLRTMVELARHELWIGNDGSIDGRLSLKFAGAVPAVVELDWPPTASPTALFVDGTFQALPVPADGRLEIPMPPGLRERDAWISWNDRPGSLPSIAGWLAARLPWPRALPIGSCRVEIYAPRRYRVEGRAPLIAVAATSEDQNLPAVLRGSQSEGDVPMRHTVMDVSPIPEPGRPFELGASLRIINERAANFGWTVAIIIPLALVLLWAGAWWPWIVQHETACWILLSIFWWLCLAPSWLGLVIAAWAIVSVRRRPAEAPAPAAASGIVPVE